MNISEVVFDFKQRGNVEELAHLQSPSELEATVTFDKDGNPERFPWIRKFFVSLVIILIALLSFGIGRLSVVGYREPIRIEYDASLTTYDQQTTTNTASAINSVPSQKSVVASKTGKKYHYAHCPGAKQIKEANKIVFASAEAAEASGYTLAANCQAP